MHWHHGVEAARDSVFNVRSCIHALAGLAEARGADYGASSPRNGTKEKHAGQQHRQRTVTSTPRFATWSHRKVVGSPSKLVYVLFEQKAGIED